MASVRQLKRPNKEGKLPWIVEYTNPASGKRVRATPPSGLKKDAQTLRQRIEQEINEGRHVTTNESKTFREVAEMFIRHYEQRMRDGLTSRGRLELIKSTVDRHLVGHLGSLNYSDIAFKDIETCHKKMRASGLSVHTARQYVLIGQQIDDFSMKRGFCKGSLFKTYVKELRGIKPPKVRTLQPEDVKRILDEVSVRRPRYRHHSFLLLRCTVHLATFCGLRIGEIFGLRRENVDLVNRVIHVRHNLTKDDELKGPKTSAGIRDIPLPHHVSYLIENWMDTFRFNDPRGLIFRMPDGAQIMHTNHRELWVGALDRAGLTTPDGPDRDMYHFHSLRHFNASLLIGCGVPVTDVAQLLGHERFDTTLQTYAHPIMGTSKRHDAFERMAAMFNGVDATKILKGPLSH